jgi:hypothetical protein
MANILIMTVRRLSGLSPARIASDIKSESPGWLDEASQMPGLKHLANCTMPFLFPKIRTILEQFKHDLDTLEQLNTLLASSFQVSPLQSSSI